MIIAMDEMDTDSRVMARSLWALITTLSFAPIKSHIDQNGLNLLENGRE